MKFSNILSFFKNTEREAAAKAAQTVSKIAADGTRKKNVLHVGNVANLAFVNARLLNERGYNCHLLAPDFYHFASSPEWQDMIGRPVDRSTLGDDWFPNFFNKNVPVVPSYDWVAQGPLHLAITYLYMKLKDDPRTELTRACLDYQRFKASNFKTALPQTKVCSEAELEKLLAESNLSKKEKNDLRSGHLSDSVLGQFRRVVGGMYGEQTALDTCSPLAYQNAVAYAGVDDALSSVWRDVNGSGDVYATGVVLMPEISRAKYELPAGVTAQDAAPYLFTLPWWKALFECYDEVVLYGSSVIYGLLTQSRYHAYEHGNIRSIPFEDTSLGRLTKLGYERAENVFITNTDYVLASPRLEFKPEARHYIPHAFEEKIIFDYVEREKKKGGKKGKKVKFFAPARQDWVIENPSLNKANDRVFKAIKSLKDDMFVDFEVVCVDWGQDANASKKLVEELGIEDIVSWVNPMPKGELWKNYMSSHCVIDQFFLDAFGGVTYETLAIGTRIITRDDGVANAAFFNEDPPPILAAKSSFEIATRMAAVLADPDDEQELGKAGVEWIKRCHSSDAIRDIMKAAFERG